MVDLMSFMTFQELILCCGIVVIAAILQVSIGMGFGMLASPLIALVRPDLVPGAILVMGLAVAFVGAWRERENIVLSELKFGISGRVVGCLVSVYILGFVSSIDSFLIIFGCMMLVAVSLTVSGLKIKFTDKSLFSLSIVSGVVGTITAVGAPPMAIIYHDRDPAIVRPTLNSFFFSSCVLGLFGLGLTGWLSWSDLFAAIIFLPAMLFGILISGPFKALPTKWLSRFLLVLSAVASTSLIVRGLI